MGLVLCTHEELVQLCFNEYWRRVLELVLHSANLDVLIGKYVEPGNKLCKRVPIGLPELRTKMQQPGNEI